MKEASIANLHRPPEQHGGADGDLNQSEDCYRHGRLVRKEIRHVIDGRRDQRRLANGHGPDHVVDEDGLELCRLELQQTVEDPDHTQCDLQCPAIHVQTCRNRMMRISANVHL